MHHVARKYKQEILRLDSILLDRLGLEEAHNFLSEAHLQQMLRAHVNVVAAQIQDVQHGARLRAKSTAAAVVAAWPAVAASISDAHACDTASSIIDLAASVSDHSVRSRASSSCTSPPCSCRG